MLGKLAEEMSIHIEYDPHRKVFEMFEELEYFLTSDWTKEDILMLAKELQELANGTE